MANRYLNLLALTLVRIPLALLLFVWLLATPYNTGSLSVALLLMVLIEASDFLDGYLARRLNLVSELGATLDPYADSTARLITYSALAFDNLALFAVPIAMAIRDVTVAYTRVLVSRTGGTASARFSGKAKAVVQAVGAFLLVLSPVIWPAKQYTWFERLLMVDMFKPAPVLVISWIVIIVTLASMIEYIFGAMKAVKGSIPKR